MIFRSVRLATLLFALSVVTYAIALRPDLRGMVDLQVYHAAAEAILAGDPLYEFRASSANLGFTYPPFAAVVFAPLGLVGLSLAKIGTVVAGVALIVGCLWIVYGRLELRGRPRVALTLSTAGVVLWIEPVQATLSLGQINLALMALILFDLTRPDATRWKGLGLGVATGVKLTPLIFIAYLVLTRRLRAAGLAAAATLTTVAAGWMIAPDSSARYWGELVKDPHRVGRVENSSNQTIRGVLARLMHTRDVDIEWLAVAVIIGAAGLAVAVWADRRGQRLLGVLACALTGLLVSPISWSHHWVWIVPIAIVGVEVIRRDHRPHARVLTPAFGMLLAPFVIHTIWWPPHGQRVELSHQGIEHLFASSYVLVGIVLLVLVAIHLTHD